jgi:hypothetical protein
MPLLSPAHAHAPQRAERKKSLAKLKDSIRAKTARNRGDSVKGAWKHAIL